MAAIVQVRVGKPRELLVSSRCAPVGSDRLPTPTSACRVLPPRSLHFDADFPGFKFSRRRSVAILKPFVLGYDLRAEQQHDAEHFEPTDNEHRLYEGVSNFLRRRDTILLGNRNNPLLLIYAPGSSSSRPSRMSDPPRTLQRSRPAVTAPLASHAPAWSQHELPPAGSNAPLR